MLDPSDGLAGYLYVLLVFLPNDAGATAQSVV